MSEIKSILVHLDNSTRCEERIRISASLGERFHSDVTGMYGVTPLQLRYPLGLDETFGVIDLQNYDDESREEVHSKWNSLTGGYKTMNWEPALDDSIRSFERRALYADLVILGQYDPDDPAVGATPVDFVFRQVAGSGNPVLLVPSAGKFLEIGRTVLIAWKETREAARAVHAAFPWLGLADNVHAISYADDGGLSLKYLQRFMAQHHVTITTHHGGSTDLDVGNDLLSRASDIGADLLVMGCYGHSRAREWVLGGVSRTILKSMTLPVLMAN